MMPRTFPPAIVGFTLALVLSPAGAPSCVLAEDGKRKHVVATAPAREGAAPVPAPPRVAPRPEDADPDDIAAQLLGANVAAGPDDAALGGLPAGSVPIRLTWEHIYHLAATRARSHGHAVPLETVDPTAIAARARALDVGGIEGLRPLLLEDESFDDPSSRVFELLCDAQFIKIASKNVARSESLARLFRRLNDGEVPGLTQNQLDQVDILRQRDRLTFTELVTRYRDRLDELKVALGISVHVPIAIDRTPFGPFDRAFSVSDQWQLDPHRRLTDILMIVRFLPVLEDLEIDGRSLLALARLDVDRPEDFCQAAVKIAQRHVRTAPDTREAQIRRTIRGMIRDARAYELERGQFEATLKQADSTFEALIGPPKAGAGSAVAAVALSALKFHTAQSALGANRERLLSLWSQYQAGRIRMQRFLGTHFPDWAAFERSLNPPAAPQLDDPRAMIDPNGDLRVAVRAGDHWCRIMGVTPFPRQIGGVERELSNEPAPH